MAFASIVWPWLNLCGIGSQHLSAVSPMVATILIGVFDFSTGDPIAGVMAQPYHTVVCLTKHCLLAFYLFTSIVSDTRIRSDARQALPAGHLGNLSKQPPSRPMGHHCLSACTSIYFGISGICCFTRNTAVWTGIGRTVEAGGSQQV